MPILNPDKSPLEAFEEKSPGALEQDELRTRLVIDEFAERVQIIAETEQGSRSLFAAHITDGIKPSAELIRLRADQDRRLSRKGSTSSRSSSLFSSSRRTSLSGEGSLTSETKKLNLKVDGNFAISITLDSKGRLINDSSGLFVQLAGLANHFLVNISSHRFSEQAVRHAHHGFLRHDSEGRDGFVQIKHGDKEILALKTHRDSGNPRPIYLVKKISDECYLAIPMTIYTHKEYESLYKDQKFKLIYESFVGRIVVEDCFDIPNIRQVK